MNTLLASSRTLTLTTYTSITALSLLKIMCVPQTRTSKLSTRRTLKRVPQLTIFASLQHPHHHRRLHQELVLLPRLGR